MWISWSNTDPIMDQLHLLPKANDRASYNRGFVDYSTDSGNAYNCYTPEFKRVRVTTYKEFQQVLLLHSLKIPEDEIQQHIDLGTTDDT